MGRLRYLLNNLIAQRKSCHAEYEREKTNLDSYQADVAAVQRAQEILQSLAQEVQQQAHKQVARVVSRCLEAVFHEPYELRIEFVQKRGKTEAEFVYYRNGHRLSPRMTSGGVLQTVALALRLVCLILTMPPARRLLVLDEPFQGLDEENMQKMALLVQTLSRELDVQFLIVTHNKLLEIGKVVEL